MANWFQCESLQEVLIGNIIIPNLQELAAIMFLGELEAENLKKYNHKKSCTGAWTILHLYCQYYLHMNLPSVLKTYKE